MFYTSTDIGSQAELEDIFFPNFNVSNRPLPTNHPVQDPYRLMLNATESKGDNYDFITCMLTPKGSMYSSMRKDEIEPIFEKTRLHSHSFFEYMLVLDGEIYVNIENQRHLYTKGCSCLLNKNVMHLEEYKPDFRIAFLQVSEELMNAIYRDLSLQIFEEEKQACESKLLNFIERNLSKDRNISKDYVDFYPTEDADDLVDTIHGIFDQVTRETLSPKRGSSIRIKNLLVQLFQFLSNDVHFRTAPVHIGSDSEYMLYTQIARAMSDTHGRISRSQLSEKLNYSGTYLNEISKKYSGLSLFDFGMTFCMKEAVRLLADTNENILDISVALGFSNRTHFYKIFKDTYGLTPAQYRRQAAESLSGH